MGRKAGMAISERVVGDAQRLRDMARLEKDADQRDRLRSAAGALEGRSASDIAKQIERTGRFVQKWAYAYRDGGIEAVQRKFAPGRDPKLARSNEAAFKARIQSGPTPEDGVCTLRGEDARRILAKEFGKPYTLSGAYQLLHRLGFSCLKPRPRHEKNDPAAMEAFKKDAPLLSKKSGASTPGRKSRSTSRTKRGSGSRAH